MDIEWMVEMKKMKIRGKLLITYVFILLFVFITTSILFNILSKVYLIREARQQLRIEGEMIADILKGINLEEGTIKERIADRQKLKIVGKFIDSQVIVFNNDRKIIYRDLKDINLADVIKLVKNDELKIKGYVYEVIPIFNNNTRVKGYILILTKIKDIAGLNKVMRRTQLLSISISGIVALIISIIFSRSLTKPIKILNKKMEHFSLKNFSYKNDINTGDEIGELEESFLKMAKKIKGYDERQKKFFQNTSHELKTPLMSIQGYAEAIRDGVVEDEEVEESLNIIIEESQRLKNIVDELVYLSKVEDVEENYNFEQLDLYELINRAIKTVKSLADEKNIDIKIKGNTPYIGMFDKEKLIRAFVNILGNGVRYAEKEIRINITEENKFFIITITDDGPGFSKDEEKRVFDRFYKGKNGNTGIGLAITRAVVEGHKGIITAYNNIPKGAVFKIKLPISRE